jgi:hypothetical protein
MDGVVWLVGDRRYNLLNFNSSFEVRVETSFMSSFMSTLDQVLETALQLPYEQQEILIKILQNRHHQSRRTEIAADAMISQLVLFTSCRRIISQSSAACS